MILRFLIFVTIISGTLSCACKKNTAYSKQNESISTIEKIACEKFKHDFEIQFNDKGNYILVHNKNFNTPQIPEMSYFVYSVKDNYVIIEDSLKNGKITWADKNSIIVSEKDADFNKQIRSYKYNLKKRKYRYL